MELQDRVEELQSAGIGVAAISYDSKETLAAFAERRNITFPLLSDDDSSTIKEYGILNTVVAEGLGPNGCLLYTSPSPRDRQKSRMPSSA